MSPKNPTASLSPTEDPPQQEDDSDDDDLSITSTNPGNDDSEKEWEVDDVMAERPIVTKPGAKPAKPGALEYLIKWEGFELVDYTWEPVEHLGHGLLAKWEENKADIDAGIREAFDLKPYNAARAARDKRHRRRNAKRLRLGIPPTWPFPDDYDDVTSVASSSDQDLSGSDIEAQEVAEVDPASIPSSKSNVTTRTPTLPLATTIPKAASTTQKVAKQKTFVGVPSQASQLDSSTSGISEKGRDQQPPLPLPKASAKASASGLSSGSSSVTTSVPVRKGIGGSMTGYQGTAGRTSAFRPNTAKASTQNASITTNKASSTATIPSAPSSALTNDLKAKRLTATRTRQQLPASSATNVFIGGRIPKKRRNLGDVMADPSKPPKAFSNLRITNIARKRGIEKGEVAGALSSIPSRLIIGNEQPNTKPKKPSLVSPTTITSPHNQETSSSAFMNSPSVSKPQPSAGITHQRGVEELPTLRRRKSVRFMGEEDDTLTGTIDDLFDDTKEQNTSVTGPVADKEIPIPSRKLSLAAYQAHIIQKPVRFGSGEPITVGFSGIIRHSAAWLATFKANKLLHLKDTCSSFHFLTQKQQLIGENLSAGPIEPTSHEHAAALRNVATSLQRRLIGLHLVAREYSILVYPADSDEWDWLDVGPKKPNPDIALRYLIYRSPISFQAYPSEFYNEPKVFKELIYPNGAKDPELVGVLTGLEFKNLLPQDPRFMDKQIYMLLIPLKARQLLGVITAWLRFHQRDRPIFTVEQSGSWRSFHEAVQAGAGGTIISHADFTLWKLESIPHLWRMLEDGRYTFWHLDTGENKRPQYPSNLDAASIPGSLQLTRLFPYGRAFFITPSFAISEPAQLYTFLKWFRQFAPNPGHIIVTCHDFPRFLRNIKEEKEREHNSLIELNPRNSDVYKFLDRAGRSKQDIENHVRAYELLQEIMEHFGDEETSEDIRRIHWLSEKVDPSDEQSLVNAFCWWTQLKCDRFRRFYVLGSDPSKIQRAYRYIDIPRYFDTEGSDPDVAGILEQQQLFAEELQKEGGKWRTSISEPAFSFPGTLFRTGNVQEIQRWIDEHRQRTAANWFELYQKPVSWTDKNMAAQFGDEFTKKFDSFRGWLGAAPRFSRKRNTWVGLFYTITDLWDEYVPKLQYERHPWIAILRPKNPQFIDTAKGSNTVELFIWDIAATERERFGHCLLDMQCQLIDYVYENITQSYPGRLLSDVWYSSASNFHFSPQDNPLDITCRKIMEFFDNAVKELPVKDNKLRNQWTSIDPRLWSAGMSSMTTRIKPEGKASELALKRIPQTEEDKLKPKRMIWHPIRRRIRGRGTKCLNDLHEACLEARSQDSQCGHIRYQYRPTLDWWADQVAEGRDYGYVCVDVAEKIMNRLPK
ncbi:hypothetical protein FHL15_008644 [Xylaria flabelliformis]|uniref:Chromo domain-containing protein n=1 Tax=Xylaria flabelliformis TaxID=2512241 RepID=A0A553HR97_9PEZI|nr:hypothetical protein FHL15_008644 [Xylaria flabelliformis]